MLCRSLALAASILLAPTARAGTFLIDDDGGPGVDFTSLQAAIDVASDGDLLLIRAGQYGSFTLDGVQLTLVGETGALAVSGSIRNTSIAQPVVVTGLEIQSLTVRDTNGLVVLDAVSSAREWSVHDAVDVRVHRTTFVQGVEALPSYPGIEVGIQGGGAPARLELVSSVVHGADGFTAFTSCGQIDDGEDGGAAVQQHGGTTVHLAQTQLSGGAGGDTWCDQGGDEGDGGHGLLQLQGATALAAGASMLFQGGAPGEDIPQFDFGLPGLPLAQSTGAQLVYSGFSAPGSGPGITEAVPADPVTEIVGEPAFGAPTHFRVWAPPGSFVQVHLGLRSQVVDDGQADVELLVKPARTFTLGTSPAAGFLDLIIPFSGQLAPGATLIAQARVDVGGGDVRRSNSAVAVLDPAVP